MNNFLYRHIHRTSFVCHPSTSTFRTFIIDIHIFFIFWILNIVFWIFNSLHFLMSMDFLLQCSFMFLHLFFFAIIYSFFILKSRKSFQYDRNVTISPNVSSTQIPRTTIVSDFSNCFSTTSDYSNPAWSCFKNWQSYAFRAPWFAGPSVIYFPCSSLQRDVK